MENLKMITRKLDIHAFQAEIFMSDANLFSPVTIYARAPQSLEEVFEEQKTHPSRWMSYAGPAGIGQYSLVRGKPAGILARFDAHFRGPAKHEMEADFEDFGEQVLGPAVEEVAENEREQYKGNGIFTFCGKDHYFTGPPRLVKSVFLSRVFSGNLPTDVSDLVKEVDEASETGEKIVTQGYQFLHSIDGKIKYLPFEKSEDYDPSKLVLFGTVEIEDGRMTYYPNGDKSHPIDFTETLQE